jgi:hypothetical protein
VLQKPISRSIDLKDGDLRKIVKIVERVACNARGEPKSEVERSNNPIQQFRRMLLFAAEAWLREHGYELLITGGGVAWEKTGNHSEESTGIRTRTL